jgi:hypothetical protein
LPRLDDAHVVRPCRKSRSTRIDAGIDLRAQAEPVVVVERDHREAGVEQLDLRIDSGAIAGIAVVPGFDHQIRACHHDDREDVDV